MMKKNKHQFHCEKCASPCDIYRRGKNHRVLVCPNCGVIATNPKAGKKISKRVGKAILGEIPGASAIMEGVGLVTDLTKKEKKEKPEKITYDSKDKPNYGERVINQVLYG